MVSAAERSLAHIIPDVYPGAPKVHPTIVIEPNFDARDLYRSLLEALGGFSKSEIFDNNDLFEKSNLEARYLKIVDLIEIFNRNNEVIFIIDNGGALEDDGRFSVDLRGVFDQLRRLRPSLPYLVLILFRTPPASAREKSDVYYFRVDPIDSEDVKRLISLHIKKKGQVSSSNEISRLVDLTDGHPYNIQFVLRLLDSHSIQSLIEDPSDLVAFKRRRGDEFVARIELKQPHIQVLSVLRTLGPSSIELLSVAVSLTPEEIGAALRELEEFHCVERAGNICSINRPLRSAFDRSSFLKLSAEQVTKLQSEVISIYDSYKNDDEVDIEIISAAARAAVYLNKDGGELAAFLSPANSVYVARQFYDQSRYNDCARICETALNSYRLISDRAKLETLRLRCLSLARLGEDEDFKKTFSLLGEGSSYEKALKLFLEGFRLRIKGEPADAIAAFKKSHALNSRSFATMRELSHALMQVGEMEEARRFSEEALKIAQTNPYVIDQVLALRVAKHSRVTKDIIYDPEIEELLTSLERYGDEEGKSFYAIRMADIYRRANELKEALDFAEKATGQTPRLVPAHIIQAEILIRLKQLPAAHKKIEQIGRMIDDRQSGEGRARLPDYLFLKATYLIENDELTDAIALLQTHEHRLKRRIPELKRKISFLLGGGDHGLTPKQRSWLKEA
ncbi:hypothetical protein IY145_17170 [Methylosinus sp. H3A]|uniref:hypothetical protein n=1 Tax=Methylosinus sp. H3A TaxID=2785786 RepID=UPI0018C2A2D2|nr:hypothetical protein [Methylosinus sp. H3A]MBG0811105.1 hypothetical protein [Methylosinus sp. H3A]